MNAPRRCLFGLESAKKSRAGAHIAALFCLCQLSMAGAGLDSQSFYTLQSLIQFDCLDGAIVDPGSGAISLFGHTTNPVRPLHIPYIDYLATALQCKAPQFSLEPVPGLGRLMERAINVRSEAVMDVLADPFELKRGTPVLKKSGAWLLQQGGFSVQPGLTYLETFARMLRATNQTESAEILERLQACQDTNFGSEAYDLLNEALGISEKVRDVWHREALGRITREEAEDETHLLYLVAYASNLGGDGKLYATEYTRERRNGSSPRAAWNKVESGAMQESSKLLFRKTVAEMFKGDSTIEVPSWIGKGVDADAVPQVQPTFIDLPPQSWLARTMFDADVLCKYLISMRVSLPQLTAIVPRYRTKRQFLIAAGQLNEEGGTVYERCTITPGVFEITESLDGRMIRFNRAPMVFSVNKLEYDIENDHRTDVPDPVGNKYGAEVTNLYDELAQVFPTLQKLREATKIVALALWLDRRGIKITLPQNGRLLWDPPRTVPATIIARITLKSGAIVNTRVNIEGGVELSLDKSWKISRQTTSMPPGDSTVTIAVASSARAVESELQKRLLQSSSSKEKADIQVQLAQSLRERGDAAGATRELDKAVELDSSRPILVLINAQAHYQSGDLVGAARALKNYLALQPENVPAKQLLADINKAISTRGRVSNLTRFQWDSPVVKAAYAGDERAPDLTPISGFKFKSTALPPPPTVPDHLALHPDIWALTQQRTQLVKEYSEASADKAIEIRRTIESVDAETKKTLKSYKVSWDEAH